MGHNSTVNPLGISFNPVSIARQISGLSLPVEGPWFWQKDGRWVCGLYHSQVSGDTPAQLQAAIQQGQQDLEQALGDARTICITWGTAWVYRWKSNGEVVANCHKKPASAFDKQLLQPEEIVGMYRDLFNLFPEKRWILTVSPVKHLRDGVHENVVSKGVLAYAAYRLAQECPGVYYFPAFEMVQEELRDYRFYATDMAHPSEEAVAYVFKRFCEHLPDQPFRTMIADAQQLLRQLEHRGVHPDSEAHRQFRQQLTEKLDRFEAKYGIQLRSLR